MIKAIWSKKLIDIETINQFIIQPKVEENLETISDKSINTIKVEKEFVNVKTEIVKYSKSYNKPKGPQWKTETEPSSFFATNIWIWNNIRHR